MLEVSPSHASSIRASEIAGVICPPVFDICSTNKICSPVLVTMELNRLIQLSVQSAVRLARDN
jgi:hypothetical protein